MIVRHASKTWPLDRLVHYLPGGSLRQVMGAAVTAARAFWRDLLFRKPRSVKAPTCARSRAERDLRIGEPEFAKIAMRLGRDVLVYLRGDQTAEALKHQFHDTLHWVDEAQHLVEKAMGQGDFEKAYLDQRRKSLADLQTMVHGKLDWLARQVDGGSQFEALAMSGSVMHFLVARNDAAPAWQVLMNWSRCDDMIRGFSPKLGSTIALPRKDVLDWHAR